MRRLLQVGVMLFAVSAMMDVALGPTPAAAQPITFRTVVVNCAVAGQTITSALKRQVVGQGLLVRVSGTCNEHVDIFRDDVIIRGNPTATINGPTATDNTVTIDNARRVSLEELTITGGQDGVSARGSWFTLDNVVIQGTARFGVGSSFGSQGFVDGGAIRQCGSLGALATNTSTLIITNSTIENNGGGAQANRASHLRLGQDASGTATLGPVLIRNNGGNGVTINDSSAGLIVATTIENHPSNGMYIARGSHADVGIGSFNVLGPNIVRNNGATSSGILVEGASAAIVGNSITGNGFGIQLLNAANGRIGIRPDATGYVGNDIRANRLTGVLINAATAVIGGNNVSANGTAGSQGSRFGVFVTQGSANFIGRNIIEDNPETGVFIRQGSLFLGNGFGTVESTGNIIRNNGCATAGDRGGISLLEGSTGELRNGVTVTGNCGQNISLFLGNTLEIRQSTISGAVVAPGGAPANTPGISIGTRGIVRMGFATTVTGNPGDGVFLSNGATFEIRNDAGNAITNNGTAGVTTNGFPINCVSGTETSIQVPTGIPPTFSGNLAGDAPNNCTGY
jgi:Right handed beta helix region